MPAADIRSLDAAKTMIRILLFLISTAICAVAAVPWPPRPFTEVRAYAWPNKMIYQVILPGMKLREGVLNEGGTLLSADQVKRLQKAVAVAPRRQLPSAGCHIPHNAFVFYDAAKRPVAYIEICFGCGSQATGPAPQQGHVFLNFDEAAIIFDELKLPLGIYENLDARKKGKQRPMEK